MKRVYNKEYRDPILYLDCSESTRTQLSTGVQKVARSFLEQADVFSNTLRIKCVPIVYQWDAYYTLHDSVIMTKKSRHQFNKIDFKHKDIYLCADSFWNLGIYKLFPYLKDRGVTLIILIHDLIPIYESEYEEGSSTFREALCSAIEHAHLLPCISRTTQTNLMLFCGENGLHIKEEKCPVIPLAPAVSELSEHNISVSMLRLPKRPFFVMVGSLEARRGYLEVLREFQQYYMHGGPYALLIIGKKGLGGEHIQRELVALSEQGLPVYWLSDASDAEVAAAYHTAVAVVCASRAEGYGLPVSEGLAINGRVIANRLPVFGEFAGSYPHYFELDVRGDLLRLLWSVDNLKKAKVKAALGNWQVSAKCLATKIAEISSVHASCSAIEVQQNSPEAVRWVYWLKYGRPVDPEAMAYFSAIETVAQMQEALHRVDAKQH